jgi:putative FmdB family regulatory protein
MERIQKFSDPLLTVCPHCEGELEQLVSAAAVRFKGSGWYATDYAHKGPGNAASGGNGSSTGSSTEGSGDKSSPESSKPSPTTEPKTSDGKSGKK